MYRVRIMEFTADQDAFEFSADGLSEERVAALLRRRIGDAVEARRALNLPSSETDIYRYAEREHKGALGERDHP